MCFSHRPMLKRLCIHYSHRTKIINFSKQLFISESKQLFCTVHILYVYMLKPVLIFARIVSKNMNVIVFMHIFFKACEF